jgi:hypothetical protein
MDESQDPDAAVPSQHQLIAQLAVLAQKNRPAYRKVRELLWDLYAHNSARSDFPSKLS